MAKEIKIPITDLLKGKHKANDDAMVVASADISERAEFEAKLAETNSKLKATRIQNNPVVHANLLLDKVNALLALGRKKDIWNDARTAFAIFIENHCWEQAAECCDIMYQTEEEASITALIHGIWLAVSFPVDPQLTINLLVHFIDETPPTADGAALAAATAHYIVGLRASEKDFENLNFQTTALLSKVAESHSNVGSQNVMDDWLERMGLNDPGLFLPRMGMVINAIVQEHQWWFDRDALRALFPQ